MQNSGNEAKKYLKTKHITFLIAADYARFACNLAQMGASEEQEQHNLRERTECSGPEFEARQVARGRLQAPPLNGRGGTLRPLRTLRFSVQPSS